MTHRDQQRVADILAAIDAIRSHLTRGDLADGLIFDAVRIRLLEIAEAVTALPEEVLMAEPDIRGARSPVCAITSPTAPSTPPTPSFTAPSTTT